MADFYQANMGPFAPVSIKGNAKVDGVPMFVDKLPLTLGGIAGEGGVHFGRVVSITPSTVPGRRVFTEGTAANKVVKGIVIYDPTIGVSDPGMNNYYFEGRPCTIATFGVVEISEYDTTQSAPLEGSTVWVRNSDGMLAFNDGTALGAQYTKLNAFVYESIVPNGVKIFLQGPLVATQTRETSTAAATPTADPAAGAVTAGTGVRLSSTTTDALIRYTTDGSEPNGSSPLYVGPIVLSAATTIKAIALAPGHDPSATLTAAYTIA